MNRKLKELFSGYGDLLLVKHKKTGRVGLVVNNNVINAEDTSKRIVIWRDLGASGKVFAMGRDLFHERFEDAGGDENAIKLVEEFIKGR